MHVYELALELGVRSPELVERAEQLGFPGLMPSQKLTPEQLTALRHSYAPPPPPGSAGAASANPRLQLGAPGPSAPGSGHSVGSMVAIAVAILLVAGLFGFMVTNTSKRSPHRQETADGGSTKVEVGGDDGGADPDGGEGVSGGLSGAPSTSPTTRPANWDPVVDSPVDKTNFCRAAKSAFDFELRMVEAADPQHLGHLRDVMLAGRERWKVDVAEMLESGPPRIEVSVTLYRHVYTDLLDAVTPDADEFQLAVAFAGAQQTDLRHASKEIGIAIEENCR